MAKEPKQLVKWTPTANQEAMLSFMQEKHYRGSITAACKAVGITRQAYYQWHQGADFREWWNEQSERHFLLQLPATYGAILESATGLVPMGSAPDRSLFLTRFDERFVPRSRSTIHSQVDVRTGRPGITEEELSGLIQTVREAIRPDDSEEAVEEGAGP